MRDSGEVVFDDWMLSVCDWETVVGLQDMDDEEMVFIEKMRYGKVIVVS